eukprot:scaffold504_cov141-Skeletonema_menzelii.AAC.1
MKRSHETLKSSNQSSGGGCDGPPPAKDEPLRNENDGFVRSVLRFIDDGGTNDTIDEDILDQEERRRNGDGVNIPAHVSSAWKRLDSYSRYSRHSWDGDRERTVSKPPAQDARLEAISVFYKVSDAEIPGCTLPCSTYEIKEVDAFLFHFSDGGELDSHELIRAKYQDSTKQTKRRKVTDWYDNNEPKKLKCGKFRVVIPLVEGEIRSVTALYKIYRNNFGGRWERLTGISLETSTNKCLCVDVKSCGYDTIKEETPIPKGQTLRSIQIHPDRFDLTRIFHVETAPVPEDRDNVAPISPLSILAHKAEVERLQNKATHVEDEAKKSLTLIRSEINESIDETIKRTRTSIQSSSEAAEVRRLHAELAASKSVLGQRVPKWRRKLTRSNRRTSKVDLQ